tara:strand:+ start:6024 stop:6440 length:417 start_codon:yes stop_codon:yes gene_type:complete
VSQKLLAKINQGCHDIEKKLLNLIDNATRLENQKILKAAQQRLKIVSPAKYRQIVGPLHVRDPMGSRNCYCCNPAALEQIANDIVSGNVHYEALLCDACWNEDVSVAWGTYGPFGKKLIDKWTWQTLCTERGDWKFGV